MMSARLVAIEYFSTGEYHSHCLGLWKQSGRGQAAAEPAPDIRSAVGRRIGKNSLRNVPLQRSHQRVAPPCMLFPQLAQVFVKQATMQNLSDRQLRQAGRVHVSV